MTSNKTPSEGRVRDDFDAEFPHAPQESNGLVSDSQGEGQISDLDDGDGTTGFSLRGEFEALDFPHKRNMEVGRSKYWRWADNEQ